MKPVSRSSKFSMQRDSTSAVHNSVSKNDVTRTYGRGKVQLHISWPRHLLEGSAERWAPDVTLSPWLQTNELRGP
jgi:hypothetical protein